MLKCVSIKKINQYTVKIGREIPKRKFLPCDYCGFFLPVHQVLHVPLHEQEQLDLETVHQQLQLRPRPEVTTLRLLSSSPSSLPCAPPRTGVA